jgi:hypothetical protein
VPDSVIEFEVWIPEAWNGKFQGVGNGGYSGARSYSAMVRALNAGYAAASHDTGHPGTTSSLDRVTPKRSSTTHIAPFTS